MASSPCLRPSALTLTKPSIDDRKSITRGRAASITLAFALLVAGGYVLLAIANSMPLNPVSARIRPFVVEVLEPHFTQSWTLFAPDPISDERGIVARAKCSDGTTTAHIDVTSPFVQMAQSSRWFPSRSGRMISNGIQALVTVDPLLRELRSDPSAPLSPAEQEMQNRGELVLQRTAAFELAEHCAPGEVTSVQVRVVVHEFPRWSERNDWDRVGEITYYDLDWSGDLR